MPHTVEIYSLPDCPHCKNTKAFFEKHNIEYTNYDVSDSTLAKKMIEISGQRGVPVTVIDGKEIVIGDDLMKLQNLLVGDEVPKEAPIKADHELAIIGAGAAGLPAALYAGRKELDTIVIGGAIGGMVNQSKTIENYPGIPDVPGDVLMGKIAEHAKSTGVEFLEDVGISIVKKGGIFEIETLNGNKVTAKAVIAATGRIPRVSGAKGEADYFGKGVAVCTTCDGPLYKGKSVAVIGGGNTALDMALDLADMVSEVHMIVRSKVKGDEILLNRLKTKKNVIFHNGYEVEEIYGGEFVEGIALKKLGGGTISKIFKSGIEKVPVEGVFLGIGLNPNTAMFEGLVEMNAEKEIIDMDNFFK